MKPKYCYLNGSIIPLSEAKVGVYDIGLLRGFGIYEALVVRHGKTFRFADHMERFVRSAQELRIVIPATAEEIEKAILELAAKNGYLDAVVRLILTGGESIGGIEYDGTKPTFYILVEAFMPLPEKYFTEGCSLMPFNFVRQFPKLKTINYIQAVLLQEERKKQGALEVLYTDGERVLEAATSNFFIVTAGKVITPKEGILGGITRKVAIELASQTHTVDERDVTMAEVYAADEAFITSSFKDIVPVVKVGEHTIGTGTPGPITKDLMGRMHKYIEAY